jgi:hypothetical protein
MSSNQGKAAAKQSQPRAKKYRMFEIQPLLGELKHFNHHRNLKIDPWDLCLKFQPLLSFQAIANATAPLLLRAVTTACRVYFGKGVI